MHRQHICNREVEKNPQWRLLTNGWISHMEDVCIILRIDAEFRKFDELASANIQLLATASTYARTWNISFSLVENIWLRKFACVLKQANVVRRIFTLFHKHKWKRYRGLFNRSLEYDPKLQYWEKSNLDQHIVFYIDEARDGIKFDFCNKTVLFCGNNQIFGCHIGDAYDLLFYLEKPNHILPEETWYQALDDWLSYYDHDNWHEPLFRFLDVCKKLNHEHGKLGSWRPNN
jgi:hypothetical protein